MQMIVISTKKNIYMYNYENYLRKLLKNIYIIFSFSIMLDGHQIFSCPETHFRAAPPPAVLLIRGTHF